MSDPLTSPVPDATRPIPPTADHPDSTPATAGQPAAPAPSIAGGAAPSSTADFLVVGLETPPPAGGRWQPPPAESLTGLPNLEILSLIGSGGMGAVYKARQTHLDRLVAVKVLPADRDPAFAERFAREARAMARLCHPHIVTVYDYGQTGDKLWLVMELVEGATLRQLMATGGLSPAEVLRLAPQLCDALGHAHAGGVVHRDLKPENILIDGRGGMKIADFGLAKLRGDRPSGSLTGSGAMLGTVHYMAPEQVSGAADVDHRADLYALGVILYELLTGTLPLGRFAPPSEASGLDRRIDDVVLRSLEREPDRRWQTAAEVQQAVEGMRGPDPATSQPTGGPQPACGTDPQTTRPQGDPAMSHGSNGINIGPGGIQVGDISIGPNGINIGGRPHASTYPEVAMGDSKLFRAGMALLIGGLLAGFLAGGHLLPIWGQSVPPARWLDFGLLVTAPLMVLGAISLLARVLLPLALIGAIPALLLIPWTWNQSFWLGILTIVLALGWLKPVFHFERLQQHYGSLGWRAALPRQLILVPLAVACVLASAWLVERMPLAGGDSAAAMAPSPAAPSAAPLPLPTEAPAPPVER